MFMGQNVSGGNVSGTVNSLKDIEMSQGHWNVSGTLKYLRDIEMSQGYWNVSGTCHSRKIRKNLSTQIKMLFK